MSKNVFENEIHFEELYYSPEMEEVTIYFTANTGLIRKLYPKSYVDDNIVGTEISVAFNRVSSEKDFSISLDSFMNAFTSVSPTSILNGCMTDYDWHEVSLNEDAIKYLYEIYINEVKMEENL